MKNSNKGLNHDEPILFDIGDIDKSGVDLNNSTFKENLIGGSFDDREIGLPGLSEPESIRHYVRLSRKNYSIDAGLYPLGSCTMKHNPRLNEKLARLKGFSEVHPLQPISTCQGALELIDEISNWLKELTGMEAVTMTPKAGAQGEHKISRGYLPNLTYSNHWFNNEVLSKPIQDFLTKENKKTVEVADYLSKFSPFSENGN